MKKINSKKELLKFIGDDDPYDIDEHFIMYDIDYAYPIWVEFRGITHLGSSYKVYTKAELLELKKIFEEIEED